jgi:hypothetical protein
VAKGTELALDRRKDLGHGEVGGLPHRHRRNLKPGPRASGSLDSSQDY